MARPKDLSKAQTSMATITEVKEDGTFVLLDNDGNEVGNGCGRISNSHPGYVTLVMSVYTPVIRIPLEWPNKS